MECYALRLILCATRLHYGLPSYPPPYSRKPSPFGPNVSICAKGVSRGVHNIAFLLSPDLFRVFDLCFLLMCTTGPSYRSYRTFPLSRYLAALDLLTCHGLPSYLSHAPNSYLHSVIMAHVRHLCSYDSDLFCSLLSTILRISQPMPSFPTCFLGSL